MICCDTNVDVPASHFHTGVQNTFASPHSRASLFTNMEPSIQYALNRRPHLLMAMVGAALRSLPHQTGTLRGSTESEARAAYTPVAVKVLDQMIDGQEVNEDILWSAGGQIVAQFGIGIAGAMLNELATKLVSEKKQSTGADKRRRNWIKTKHCTTK